jgi:hypothetical protein
MAEPTSPKEMVDFLVHRYSPANIAAFTSNSGRPAKNFIGAHLRHEQIERYRDDLLKLTPQELAQAYRSEVEKFIGEEQQAEERRFFNQPHAAADFSHWSRAEHWTLDEAVALAFSKAPEIVNWAKVQPHVGSSRFANQYARLRDLALRATAWKKLFDPVLPSIFLNWAEDNEIALPPALVEQVTRLRGRRIDWKANYDELRAMYDQHDWKRLVEQQLAKVQAQSAQIAELEARLAQAETQRSSTSDKALSAIERQNMLRLIYTMAVRGYSYKPEEKRSKVISEIVSDMELEGLSVSDDTVRRYLKEACDRLSDWRKG